MTAAQRYCSNQPVETHSVRLDYRPVHTYTMTNEVKYIEPKQREY